MNIDEIREKLNEYVAIMDNSNVQDEKNNAIDEIIYISSFLIDEVKNKAQPADYPKWIADASEQELRDAKAVRLADYDKVQQNFEDLKKETESIKNALTDAKAKLKSKVDELKSKDDELKSKVDELKSKDDELKSKDDELKSKDDEIQALTAPLEDNKGFFRFLKRNGVPLEKFKKDFEKEKANRTAQTQKAQGAKSSSGPKKAPTLDNCKTATNDELGAFIVASHEFKVGEKKTIQELVEDPTDREQLIKYIIARRLKHKKDFE
ncbi:hypothetical protein PV-S19_0242 [Pacmanvirus S19]|nr:hypothetical protein PV-S19_0242 [Pacmanvirus S19]